MRVVVIGNGKVGKTVVENTLQEGHEVIIVDKKPSNIEETIDQYDKDIESGKADWIDVLNPFKAIVSSTPLLKKSFRTLYIFSMTVYMSASFDRWFRFWRRAIIF